MEIKMVVFVTSKPIYGIQEIFLIE